MPKYIGDAISGFFGQYGSLLLLGAVMIGMILLMIIPQKKQQKKIKEMLDGLKRGDKIRTVGGFSGTIDSVEGDVVILKTNPTGKRIAIARQAVSVVGDNTDVENTMSDSLQ